MRSQCQGKSRSTGLRLSIRPGGRVGFKLAGHLAAQYASQAEDARTEQHDAAGLRSVGGRRSAAEREGFAAESAVTKIGSALPEVTSRRTAATAVRDVPPFRAIVA